MEKSIIEKKSENLININNNDNCIRLLRINKNNYVDLTTEFKQELLNELFFNKTQKTTLFFHTAYDEAELKNLLNKINLEQEESFFNDLKKYFKNIELDTPIIDFIKQDFKKNSKWFLKQIYAYNNLLANNIFKLKNIEKQERKNMNKKGIFSLYAGRYFLYLKITDGVYIRAPLIFLPIKIDRNENFIQRDGNWIVNEKLLILLAKLANENITIQDEYSIEELLKQIQNLINNKNLEINQHQELFKEYLNAEFVLEQQDKPTEIKDQTVLGLYSINDAILYKEINQLKEKEPDYDPFIDDEINFTKKDVFLQQEATDKSLFLIDENVDIYQRYAIRCALKQDTIIFGPPGTGKSQVISNLLLNILINNETALIVAEKITAINVILKRLKKLNIFFLPLTHYDNKNEFYNSFKSLKEAIQNDWFYPSYEKEQDETRIKQILEQLNQKQLDVNLKQEFYKYQNIFANSQEKITTLKKYYEIENALGNKQALLKTYEFCVKYYESIRNVLVQKNINQNEFLSSYSTFAKNIGFNNLEQYQSVASLVQKIQQVYPNLLQQNPLNYLNKQEQINKVKDLFDKGILKQEDLVYITNNYTDLMQDMHHINELMNKYINLIDPRLHNKNINDIKNFYNYISQIHDLKNKAFKYENFLNNQDVFVELKGLKKLTYKKQDIALNDWNYIQDIARNTTLLNEKNLLYYQYQKLLFNEDAIYFYIKELNDPLFIQYFNQQYYLFDIKYYKYFLQNDFNFIDCQNYLDLNNYRKEINSKIGQISNLNLQDIINQENEKIKLLSQNNLDLVFELMILRLRLTLAKLSKEDKKEMQIILATGDLKIRPEIFKFISSHQRLLQILFPVWLGNPENVARNLSLQKNLFKYGIFDEASQVYLEKIYSIIYRTQIKIVSGDDKQIQPKTYFSTTEDYDPDLSENIDYSTDAATSLLEKAKSLSWNEFMLINHYRSNNAQLIKFSSQYFYDNKLEFASYNNQINKKAIDVIDVIDGVFDNNGINKKEAEVVIDLLKQNYKKYNSIIVITSNVSQMNYLENLMNKEVEFNHNSDEKEEDNNFNISIVNLENIQGEEAELVIYDVTYAKKTPNGAMISYFGPINQADGKYRINVAATRAKKAMIIVKSFDGNEIKNNTQNESIEIFKQYLLYVQDLQKQNPNELVLNNIKHETPILSNQENQEIIYAKLNEIKNKNHLKTNYLIGSKVIDFIYFDENYSNVKLIVIFDDFNAYTDLSKWLEKIDFQRFLIARGYLVYRFNIYEWFTNSKKILDEINSIINKE